MSRWRLGCALLLAGIAGCTVPAREDSATAAVVPQQAWGAPDAEPLAARDRAPSGAEMLAYQQFWCARKRSARILRRLQLDAPTDALELLLLDYCDEARRVPRQLERRLVGVATDEHLPADGRAYLEWLRWHLQGFAAAATESAARERELRETLERLRAIERDVDSRDTDAEKPP